MQKHDYTQNTIASISDAITNSKNTVENGVLSIEGMAYPWDAGIIHNVVTWFEVLEILGLKEQLKVAFEGADGKFSGVVQKIGKVDSDAANAMNNPLNTLLAIKEKADVIQENSLKPVNVAGIFSGLHSTIWSIDEKYNKLDFNKMTDEEKKAYYETLMAKEELTEEDKKKIQDYLDYLQGKFTVDDTITDEEKYFIDLYEKLHPDEAKAIGTFFENSSKDGIQEYDKFNIKYIAYTSGEPYHKIFFSCIADIKVETWENDGSLDGTAISHYNNAGSVYLNIDKNGIKDTNGSYTTVFHELGHAIDDRLIALGDTEINEYGKNFVTFSNFFECIEDQDGFYEILYSDLRKYLTNFTVITNKEVLPIKLNNDSIDKIVNALLDGRKRWSLNPVEQKAYSIISTSLSGGIIGKFSEKIGLLNADRAVSDVSGGLTNNTITGAYGHTESQYWYEKNGTPTYAQNKEFFAEYFSYVMTGQSSKLDELKKVFPNACRILEERLSNALNMKDEFDNCKSKEELDSLLSTY